MNLPSSLALSQSKFFQSRLGILLLALVGLAIAGGILLLRRSEPPALPVLPTPATSPAAQVPPKVRPVKMVTYGPAAPSWSRTDVPYGPPAPAEFLTSVTAPAPGSGATTAAPATLAPAEPSVTSSAATSAVTPAPAAAIGAGLSGEIPKSVDASVLFAREHYEYVGGG